MKACLSSGINTATNAAIVIASTAGKLHGVQIVVKTTSDPIVIIYDNATVRSGNVLYKRRIDSSVEGLTRIDLFPNPVVFSSGCVLSCTGTDGADESIIFYTT